MNVHQSRQSFLGVNNAEVLGGATMGIVGLCGGGSHVCQQMAHAGVGQFVIADFDYVDHSNLNRMVGSCRADANAARRKVSVMKDMIRRINPTAKVVRADGEWQHHAKKFRDCSVIIGCVDRFTARDELERFCRRFLIPYIDIGMDVFTTAGGHSISGQVALSVPGGPCLWCLGVLTQERLAMEQQNYGAAGGRPQVIWPNGVLASIAVGQAISLLLPWNRDLPMHAMIEYDGNRQTARESTRLALLKDRVCAHYCHPGGVGDPFFQFEPQFSYGRLIGRLRDLGRKLKTRPRMIAA
jgi:hypothetical protein